jgi:hypothetical protein
MDDRRRVIAASLVAAVAAALVATWPAPIRPDLVIGHWNHPDALSDHWLLRWVADRVLHGGSLLDNGDYYWPVGDHPLLAGNGSEGFLYLPFALILAWPASATAYCVAVLIGNGLAAAWGARRFGADAAGCAVAAFVFAANPYVLQEMGSGRFTQANAMFLALSLSWLAGVGAAVRAGRAPPAVEAAGIGVLAGVGTALYWYHGVFLALAGAWFLGVHLATSGAMPWRAAAAFVAGGAAVVAGPLWWFASHWALIPGTAEGALFPHPEAIGDSVPWTLPFAVKGAHQAAAIGVPALIAAVAGCVRLYRADRRSFAVIVGLAVGAVLLARGPALWGAWPDPYTLIYGSSSMLRRFWWPSRHLVLLHWAVAVAAGVGLSGRWRLAIGALVAMPLSLAAGRDLWRLPLSSYEEPAFYRDLRDLPAGAVAEVPLSPRLAGNQQLLIYQQIYRKPLWNGHAMWVARVRPPAWDALRADNAFLAAICAWEEGRSAEVRFAPDDLRALRQRGLRWVTLNREYVPKGMAASYLTLLETLFGPPALDAEGRAYAWDVERYRGADVVRPPVFHLDAGATLANGIQPMISIRPASLGFHLYRDTSKPFQGTHPAPGERR